MAQLYFRYGAMNSGKSIAIMQVAHNYEENDKKVIVIKSMIDTKDEDHISSRIGLKRKVDILVGKDESFVKYYKNWKKDNLFCILIDEAQFLTESQVDELFYVSKILDIPVVCYGLKTDSKSYLFEGSKRLLELSDKIEEIPNICNCGKKARFNARYFNGKFTLNGNQVAIDGSDQSIQYKPLCGKCFLLEKQKIKE